MHCATGHSLDFAVLSVQIKCLHQLKQGDTEQCTIFTLQFLARMTVDVAWPWNILWTNEAHVYLNDQVNMHSYHICPTEDPHVIHEKPKSLCTLQKGLYNVVSWQASSFGPIFEEPTQTRVRTCSVTGKRFRDMLTTFVIPQP